MLLYKLKLALGSFPIINSHNLMIFYTYMVGAVLEATESRKQQANDDKCLALGWVSTPLAVDSYGAWGRDASILLAQVTARLAIHKSLPKSQTYFNSFFA